MKIVLASASPRRKELLERHLKEFEILPSDTEEIIPENYPPDQAPELLALQKATAVAALRPDAVVIGADTGVLIDGQLFGKPKDTDHAIRMLECLSGRTHTVITGCAIIYRKIQKTWSVKTEVTFYPLSRREIEEYVATGEPMDKAGSYGIQQKGTLFVKKINGDYNNVVGLPLTSLIRELKKVTKE